MEGPQKSADHALTNRQCLQTPREQRGRRAKGRKATALQEDRVHQTNKENRSRRDISAQLLRQKYVQENGSDKTKTATQDKHSKKKDS